MFEAPKKKAGKWIEPGKSYLAQCCDCKLVHLMKFRYKNNKIGFKVYRVSEAVENPDGSITITYDK